MGPEFDGGISLSSKAIGKHCQAGKILIDYSQEQVYM